MAMEVAKAFGRSKPTARNIIKWEKEWMALVMRCGAI